MQVQVKDGLAGTWADVVDRTIAFLNAALAGNHKMVAGLLIGSGADVNAADAQGWRPLHLAAANNNLDSMKQLVAQGAEVGASNGEGRTALSLAQELLACLQPGGRPLHPERA